MEMGNGWLLPSRRHQTSYSMAALALVFSSISVTKGLTKISCCCHFNSSVTSYELLTTSCTVTRLRSLEQRIDLILDHWYDALALLAFSPTGRGSYDAVSRPGRGRRGSGSGGRSGGGDRSRVSDTARRSSKRRRWSGVQAAPFFRFALQQRQTKSSCEGPCKLWARETRRMRE